MNQKTVELPLPVGSFMPPLPDLLPNLNEMSAGEALAAEGYPSDVLAHPELAARMTAMPRPVVQPVRVKSLRAGCYLIKLTSSLNPLSVEDGTLRVESHHQGRTASGDLYKRPILFLPPARGQKPVVRGPILAPGPKAADGIPILPRNRYRHYLRVTRLLEGITFGNSFALGFESWRFDPAAKTWTNEGPFTAQMAWTTAPVGYPSAQDYLEGDVRNAAGTVVGRFAMGWISAALRKAVVEIDRVSASECPRDNGAGIDWHGIFNSVGWDVTMVESNLNVPEPSGESWNEAELHHAMLNWRDSADLDRQWRFHLLCVRRLDMTERGIMYDAYGGDSNNIPREGAALASHWQIPNTALWGKVRGMRFGAATVPYFRTAIHELGHAMMMFHPGYSKSAENQITQVTPQIAANAVLPVQFPDNVDFHFAPDDALRLRHNPDVVVRPGSVLRFGQDVGPAYAGMPISPLDFTADIEDLTLRVSALTEAVPIGAPVRVRFNLLNEGTVPIPVPKKVGFKSGLVTGQVIDPAGTVRTFSTIVRALDEYEMTELPPLKKYGDDLTLLRGPEGALFTSPGLYKIIVTLAWDGGGAPIRLSGETTVMVMAPVDQDHALLARRILDTPDTLLALVVGGDHLVEAKEVVQDALKHPVLRPHFAYLEAKRLAQRFGGRKADPKAAAEFLTDDTIMSAAEIKKAVSWLKVPGVDAVVTKAVGGTLRKKVKVLDVGDEIRNMVESL